jgi:hypothetical protein
MRTKAFTEFRLRINGINLPKSVQNLISEELEKALRRGLARTDMKGSLVNLRGMALPSGPVGRVFDYETKSPTNRSS